LGVRTNNEAEYEALLLLLEEVARRDLQELLVLGDSRLVICQMQGVWKIREERLRELADRARRLALGRSVRYEWIPREQNARADRLSNRALDESGGEAGKTSSVSSEKSNLTVPEWLEPPEAPDEKPAADGGEPVILEPVEPYIYLVRGGETYAVDTRHKACTCREFLFRRVCRHLRAALEREAVEMRAVEGPSKHFASEDVENPSR
jgi:ribonuclease HI